MNCSQIMASHIEGREKHLSEFSKEQKRMRSALQLLSDDTFNQAFLLQAEEAANQVCILL